jgi:DNA adenine methylase
MKYMGSKNRHAKELLPIILKDRKEGQCYVEPFVGGANMIDKVDGWRIGSDVNEYLIEFLRALQNGFKPPSNIDLDLYVDIRDNKERYTKAVVGCVGFCFTYSAKWFGGFIGNSKDVVCKGRDRIGESYRAIEKARKQVQGVSLARCSYDMLDIPTDSIIYCDPPYANTTKYKDDFDHEDFWQWCREAASLDHKVFISEYSAPDDFICVWEKEVNNSLTKNTGAKKGIEKLFIHKSQDKGQSK